MGPASQRGFTLLEVLVAILILSFGVLGVLGLQALALQANKEARYQSTAVRLARELGELMRGNKDIAITANNPYLVSNYTGTLPSYTANCFTAACASKTEVAQFQIRDWLSRVSSQGEGLPGARVVVCIDSTPYSSAGLPVWACSNTGDSVVVKIGWTHPTTNRADASASAILDLASSSSSRPSVIVPLIAGRS